MSTTTEQPIDSNYIPNDSEVATPVGGRAVWRIASGAICTGREEDGTLRERDKVVGRLRRIGVHHGLTKDTSEPYGQLEADWETAEGMVRVKVGITEKGTGLVKPGVSAITYATGLLELAKDELAILTANQSSKKNKFGKYSTYANLYHYNPVTKAQKETARRPRTEATMNEQWEQLEAELRLHPAFAERPASESDESDGAANTHLSAFIQECAAKGWVTPEQNPAAWLKLMAKASVPPLATPHQKLSDHSDDQWGELRQAMAGRTEIPKALAPAQAEFLRTGAPAAPPAASPAATGAVNPGAFDEEVDPFADE